MGSRATLLQRINGIGGLSIFMKKHTVLLLVGGSASGKDSVANKLTMDKGYRQLISYTTRPRRGGEGDTHIFITNDEVEQYQEDMIAYTKIGSFQYFATRQQLENSDIYVIDPTGAKYLKQIVDDIKFITVHINLPEEVRFQRAIKRGDKKGNIIKRFIDESTRFEEFMKNGEYDYSITNHNLEKTAAIIQSILEWERWYG